MKRKKEVHVTVHGITHHHLSKNTTVDSHVVVMINDNIAAEISAEFLFGFHQMSNDYEVYKFLIKEMFE